MSRHGYIEDCDFDALAHGRWRAQVASAIRGKRGQAFLRELVAALDAMPEKKLITDALVTEAPSFIPPEHAPSAPMVCAIGSVGARRGIDLARLDPDDYDNLANVFGIAHQLVQEIEYFNDEARRWSGETQEQRWQRMRDWAARRITVAP